MKNESKKPGRIKSALLSWLGVPISLTNGDFWAAYGSQANTAGQTVNQNTVLSLSAAWACTRLISETGAMLPLKIYERTGTGRRLATEHSLYNILQNKPNASSTAVTFWESAIASTLLRGNAFAEKRTIGGRIVALDFLMPDRIKPKDKTCNVFIYIDENGKPREIPAANIFHIAGFSLDGKWGVSTIAAGATVFGSALAAGSAANNTFKNGLMPTVAFTTDKAIKKEQRADFREAMEAVSGAMNAGQSPVLENGMDAKMIGISPGDAQLLESRGFSVEEVCRWFRVDPSLVGHGNKDSNFGTGLEQKMLAFLTFTLSPMLVRIEQAINNNLLSPADRLKYYAEFSIEGLLRADSTARAAFYSTLVNNGIITRDEVRVKENLEPRGGNADVLTVQSAMTPLDSIGHQSDATKARAAISAWLNSQEDDKNAA
jgi:HK97 family phage portal protein